MDPYGTFTIGLYLLAMTGGEPEVKCRIIYSCKCSERDAKAMADKHREKAKGDYADHHYDYEFQPASYVI
jgi:hypothetical protein